MHQWFTSLFIFTALLIAGCQSEPKIIKLTPAERDHAFKQAKAMIDNAVVPQWYSSRLTPYVKIHLENDAEKSSIFQLVKNEKAKPSVRLAPLWRILALGAVVYSVVLIFAAFESDPKYKDKKGEMVTGVMFFTVFLPVILIIPGKFISYAFLEEDKYIPWHFILFFVHVSLIFISIVLMLYEIYKRTFCALKIGKASEENTGYHSPILKSHISELRSQTSLLDGIDDDNIILQIHDIIDGIAQIKKSNGRLIRENYKELEFISQEIKNRGYGEDMITKRLRQVMKRW